MQYIILALVLILGVILFYRLLRPTLEPDFYLKGALPRDKLGYNITQLAASSKKYCKYGCGMSFKLIKKHIDEAYQIICSKAVVGEELFEFERWIYDNYYKLNETYFQLKKLSGVFFNIPHCGDAPRIYDLVSLIVKSSDGVVSDDLFEYAISVYNLQAPLTFKEICNLKHMLKYVILEYIAIFCVKSISINKKIFKGRIDGAGGKADYNLLKFNSYIYGYSLVINYDTKIKFNEQCESNGTDLHTSLDHFFTKLSQYNGMLQGAFTTLAKMDVWFDDEYTIKLSFMQELFCSQKSSNYSNLTLSTKFLYFNEIYKTSQKNKTSELSVCKEIFFKTENGGKDMANYILSQPKGNAYMRLYVFFNIFIALLFGAFLVLFLRGFSLLFALVSLPILICISGMFIKFLLSFRVKSRQLPAYDLNAINHDNCRTLICVPRLIGGDEEIEDAFNNLQTIICANYADIFGYGLMLDLPSAPAQAADYDEKLLKMITDLYNKQQYKDRIIVIVRNRKKVDGEEKYQGWEKKRGAIVELNDAIITKESDFMLSLGTLINYKYVITLDSDTLINSGKQLVEIMSHPYNNDKAVISINMRANPCAKNSTFFTKIFCGAKGLNNYQNYLYETENDLFGCGNFTGKGIYRVKEFREKTANAFLDNRILSHDFIEGAFSGCANSNIQGMDSFPKTYSQFLTRELRWLRGDWQLLPYVFPKVKNRDGKKIKNTISPISKWHIISNIIYTIIPTTSIVLILLSFLSQMPIAIILLALSLPIVRCVIALRGLFFNPKSVLAEFVRQIFYISVLPTIAASQIFSIAVTLKRLIFKQKLLEWKVFAHGSASVSFIPNVIMGIVLTSTAAIFSFGWVYYLLSFVFIVGLLLNSILNQSFSFKKNRNFQLDSMVIDAAKLSLEFFRAQGDQEHNYLPCDNFQEQNQIGWAVRTSPTNIGLYLTSFIAAYELKLIDFAEVESRIEKAICSIEKLPKWRGNLFNWIDVTKLEQLNGFVSCVDSGNFLACLLCVSAYVNGDLKHRVNNLIDETDIGALFDDRRGLFYIGYDADSSAFTHNHYDLMGSESALTYLVATGTHKVDKKAWDNLSRATVKYAGTTLYSWTGGMFEYLMSRMFFEFDENSLMQIAGKNAVHAQIKYAKSQKLECWGVSECQFSSVDDCGNYQYRAFGIPQIAFSNVFDTGMCSPYSTFLALPYAKNRAAENLQKFYDLGCLGIYGFYESVDLKTGNVQKTFMSHHQGMIMMSAANFITDDSICKKLMRTAPMRAAAMLLSQCDIAKGEKRIKAEGPLENSVIQSFSYNGRTSMPAINLLSNGKFRLITNSCGGNYALYSDNLIINSQNREDGFKIFAESDGKRINLLSGSFTANEDNTIYENSIADLNSSTKITVLPGINGYAVTVKVIQKSENSKNIKFVSYGELNLSTFNAHNTHAAYSKMFVETGLENNFMWAKRTNENKFYAAHFVENIEGVRFESSRFNIRERSNKRKHPSFGRVLDPVFSYEFSAELKPHIPFEFTSYIICDENFEKLKSLVRLVSTPNYMDRVIGNAYALSKYINISKETKMLAAKILYGSDGSLNDVIEENRNKPNICINVKNANSMDRFLKRLKEIKPLFDFNISFNLIIIFKEKYNYYLQLTDMIHMAVRESEIEKSLNGESSLKIINCTDNQPLLEKIINSCVDIGKISIENLSDFDVLSEKTCKPHSCANMEMYEIVKKMGIGGYTEDCSYAMDLSKIDTPAAWSNVFASSTLGSLVTESGGGYTFTSNARENKLTVWNNDPLDDVPSEAIILGENEIIWSITKKPIKTNSDFYVLHSFGFSEFKNNYNGILSKQKVFCAKLSDTKFYDIELKNCSEKLRHIDVMFTANLVMGDFKHNTKCSLEISKLSPTAIKACNKTKNFTAYFYSSRPISSCAFHKEAFCNNQGQIVKASELIDEGSETYLSYSVRVPIMPGHTQRVIFTMGTDEHAEIDKADEFCGNAYDYYSNLSPIKSESSDLKYLLKWLPYQVLCSRFNGRTGLYQSGGAFGFRDQLQDCLALMYIDAKLVRNHILECAKRQFIKGDVLHWWHEPSVGVRTRICDDRLFLPYVVSEYIDFTRDHEIIAERIPYLEEITMTPEDVSVYASLNSTDYRESLLEHCIKAIDISCEFGENGLMLMRGGDWNDAMDKVGEKGYGTSVWCSMFLYFVINKFLRFINDKEIKARYIKTAENLLIAVNAAWEGDRFTRAYTDDGKVLGSNFSEECKIDLLTQSWATLSDITDDERKQIALNTAADKLVDKKNNIIKLLDPPFHVMPDIGYISSYPLGVRENGGQYTHAAIWFIMAKLRNGKTDEAYSLFDMINPNNHSDTLSKAQEYCTEPYVISADVYAGEFGGKGGWSWYTGSAAWLYKCIVEEMLGIKIRGKTVTFSPKIPTSINELKFSIKTELGEYNFIALNSGKGQSWKIKIGEVSFNSDTLNLTQSLVGKKIYLLKI